MHREKYDIFCALIILYDKNKILLQHRTDDAEVLAGYWAFFGGGIQEGETPFDAVMRETQEELCYQLSQPKLVLKKEFYLGSKKGYMHVYTERYNQSPLILNEGQNMRWYSIDEIEVLEKVIPHDRDVMKYILKNMSILW